MRAVAAKSPSNDSSTKNAGVSHRHIPGPKSVPFFTGTNTFIQTKSICPCDGGCPTCTGVIQPKLTIGQPNDKYEQEADRVADRIMRMPEKKESLVKGHWSFERGGASIVQTKRIAEQISPLVQRKCSSCGDLDEDEPVQLKSSTDKTPPVTAGLQSQIQSLKGGGQPLPESTRAFFEPRFGQNFSLVRVHTDAKATDAAKLVNARAFTTGRDVVFGAGQFVPQTATGKRLLAHELSHVVQQSTHGIISIQRSLGSEDKCEERGPAVREIDEDNPFSGLPPLIYSEWKVPDWISVKKRSKRPSVGYAQRLLNKFLVMYDNKKSGKGTEQIECVGDKKNLDEIDSIRKSLNPKFLEEDCWFGNETDKAAIMFQLCKGLEADGKIGENTWPQLENLKGYIPHKPAPPKIIPVYIGDDRILCTNENFDDDERKENKKNIRLGHEKAKEITLRAINRLLSSNKPVDLFERYFMDKSPDEIKIERMFREILEDLEISSYKYICEHCPLPPGGLEGMELGWVENCNDKSEDVHLCMNFLNDKDAVAFTIVHEVAHRIGACFEPEKYCCIENRCHKSLSPDDALENADSYANFARENSGIKCER